MAKVSDGVLAITGLMLIEGARTWKEWTPSLSDVRMSEAGDLSLIADTRAGEFTAAVIILGVGGALTFISDDKFPLIAGLISVMVLSAMTEKHLRAVPIEAKIQDGSEIGLGQVSELPGLTLDAFEQ